MLLFRVSCFSLWAAVRWYRCQCEGGVLEARTAVFFWGVSPGVGKGVMGAAGLLLTNIYRVCCGVECACGCMGFWALFASRVRGGCDVAVVSVLLSSWALPGGTVPGINAVPHDDNARYFSVVILGPQDSPYAGTWLRASSAGLSFIFQSRRFLLGSGRVALAFRVALLVCVDITRWHYDSYCACWHGS